MMQPFRFVVCFLCAAFLSGCGDKDEDTQQSNNSANSALTLIVSSTELSFVEPENGSVEIEIELKLTAIPTNDVSFDYVITPGSATEGVDYVGGSGNVLFTEGNAVNKLLFTINGDDFDEDTETFSIGLSNPIGLSLGEYTQISVDITDEDPTPEISFTTDVSQVIEGVGIYEIGVVMTSKSQKDIEIAYQIDGLASPGQDYKVISNEKIIIESGKLETVIEIDFLVDNIAESGESLIISLLTPSSGELGELNKTAIIIRGDISMNDTGIVTWFVGDSFVEESKNSDYPNQDAEYGRDVNNTAPYDGISGFDLSKLDVSGNVLPSDATVYRCIRDNIQCVRSPRGELFR